MKIYNKTLRKGYKLLRTGKHGKVISLLEPKVPLFLENYNFYYFLGAACYHTGDMGGAETYLKRAIQVNRKSEDPRLFLAGVYLKKKDTTEAVRIWLGLLDLNPGNKKAKKGLNKIRRISDQEILNTFLDSGNFAPFLPRTRKLIPGEILITFAAALILIALYATMSYWLPLLPKSQKDSRENLSLLYKEIENNQFLNEEKSQDTVYILSEKEVRESLKKAQELFDQYRDNEARVEINRLKYSNASEEIKQKAQMLEGYLHDPDITSLTGNFSYRDVANNPELYENCLVLWKGKISNLSYNEEGMIFDFLVGYEKSQILEGIVGVLITFPVQLDSAYPLEMLAKVKLTNQGTIRLQAIAVHNIIEQ